MGHIRNVAVKAVTEQVINMLTNNIIEDNGTESFVGWCEDGDVFDLNGLSGDYLKEAIAMMKAVAPIVDELTFCHLNYGY